MRFDTSKSVNRTLDTPRKFLFQDYLDSIEWENGEACRKMYADHKEKFEKAKGSSVKHQAWEWGYIDHMEQIMGLATDLYPIFVKHCWVQPFSLSDAYLTLFLHDLEKPWKYAGNNEEKTELASYQWDVKSFMMAKAWEYSIQLTTNHLNALKYVHGEWEDYDPNRNVMNPLAAFIHACDTLSARGGYNFPSEWMRFSDRE